MGQEPEDERVLGVFGDEQAAEAAAEAARAAGAEEVRVNASEDHVAALRAEMREEAAEAQPGLFTPEMKRSVPLTTAIAALLGVAVALPLGFFGTDDVPLGTRLLIVGLIGAVTGATIGFIFGVIGGGRLLGRRRRPKSTLAAERGVVVGATDSTSQVAPTLGDRDPIRVDKADPSGQPKETVAKERRRRRRQ